VIFVVALASILVYTLAYSSNVNAKLNAVAVRGLQAEYLLKSTLSLARKLIKEDQTPEDTATDPWGFFLNGAVVTGLLPIEDPNVVLTLEIKPEDGKIRIDQLVQSGSQQRWGEVLFRLFTNLGFNEDHETDQTGFFKDREFHADDLVGVLIDYMDADSDSFAPTSYAHGMEADAPEGVFANERISTIDDLKSLPGFTPNRLKKLSPYLTTRGRYKININTAPREVIKALHPDINDDIVNRIIERRTERPFTRPDWVNELRDIVGQEAFNHISTMVDIESSWFQVLAKAEYGGLARYYLRAIVYEDEGDEENSPKIHSLELF